MYELNEYQIERIFKLFDVEKKERHRIISGIENYLAESHFEINLSNSNQMLSNKIELEIDKLEEVQQHFKDILSLYETLSNDMKFRLDELVHFSNDIESTTRLPKLINSLEQIVGGVAVDWRGSYLGQYDKIFTDLLDCWYGLFHKEYKERKEKTMFLNFADIVIEDIDRDTIKTAFGRYCRAKNLNF
jgi:archaellum component FlaC